MKKIILVGRSECGKTTLTQAMRGERVHYHKTQYVNYYDSIIDTPGEYAQVARMGHALAVYTYEADVVGMLLSSTEPYSLYPPNATYMTNRRVVGIVTKVDDPRGCPERAARWLRLAGCRRIFYVNSIAGEGVDELLRYLADPGDLLPDGTVKREEEEDPAERGTVRRAEALWKKKKPASAG